MKDALKVDSGGKLGCKGARLGHCSPNPAYFKEKTICLPATFFVIGYGGTMGSTSVADTTTQCGRNVVLGIGHR